MFRFPFGSQLEKVEQRDRSPKKAFVLGVYASAVHAKWRDQSGKTKIQALAVASEPDIFWRGDGADRIIDEINHSIPSQAGKLEPAHNRFNGASGRALDEKYLQPLGLSRDKAWLCDILPYTRLNRNQLYAILENYSPLEKKLHLSRCTVPAFKKTELNDSERRNDILSELKESNAEMIILLGDEPIKRFLSFYIDHKYKKLSDTGENEKLYGRIHELDIDGVKYNVLPLAHPRQVGKLGQSNPKWYNLHQHWMSQFN